MCETWLGGYSSTYDDHIPHRKEVYLPPGSNKNDLYAVFKEEKLGRFKVPKESLFFLSLEKEV